MLFLFFLHIHQGSQTMRKWRQRRQNANRGPQKPYSPERFLLQCRHEKRKVVLPLTPSIKHVSTATEREERETRGRDTEGYSYCLPPDGFFALSFWVPDSQGAPESLSWPYIARFNISWQLRGGTAASSSSGGGGSIKSVSWSSPEAAQTSTCCTTHTHTQNRVQ